MNFYCILAIVLVLVLALTQKDFGPMAKAEARAAATGELDDPVHKKENSDTSTAVSGFTPRAINLLLPVGALIAVMFIALIVTGNGNLMNGSGMKSSDLGCYCSVVSCSSPLCNRKGIYSQPGN